MRTMSLYGDQKVSEAHLRSQFERVAFLRRSRLLQQLYSTLELADGLHVGKTPRSSLTRDRKIVRGLMWPVCLLEIIGEFRRHFVCPIAIGGYHLLGDSL